jgi:dihydroorotate dehydrogenase (NAD+) catalytic subunit
VTDLRAKVGSLELVSPVIAAAGTYGYGLEYDGLVDWSKVGAICVKGLSCQPWEGHPAPRMIETPAGMLNAIGLQNVGVEAFARDKLPALREIREQGPRIVANCWADFPEQYESVVGMIDGLDGVDAIELNLACPNKGDTDCIPASDAGKAAEIVRLVRPHTAKPLWVKLTPNVTDVSAVAHAVEDAGADAISLVNTLRGMAIDARTRRPLLTNVVGGLSGPAIKPVALYMVWQVSRAVRVPVIGGGGAVSGEDVVEFLEVGASAVQVGTASLYDPAAPARITGEVSEFLQSMGESSVADVTGTLALD